MADDYIDYFEVGEYGEHFIEEAKKLIGTSDLVNIEGLILLIQQRVKAVDAELEKVGIKRSALRTGQAGTEATTVSLRREIDRFYNYLGSLDDDVTFDMNAFFAEGNLGPLASLKPADVKSKADDVLRGFAVPANQSLPDRPKWEGRLVKARHALQIALSSKGSAQSIAQGSTAALVTARAEFLISYNGVAKRLIQGLLNQLGRPGELRLFFKDLQVNERPSVRVTEQQTTQQQTTPVTDATSVPDKPVD